MGYTENFHLPPSDIIRFFIVISTNFENCICYKSSRLKVLLQVQHALVTNSTMYTHAYIVVTGIELNDNDNNI